MKAGSEPRAGQNVLAVSSVRPPYLSFESADSPFAHLDHANALRSGGDAFDLQFHGRPWNLWNPASGLARASDILS
jgi:hypothetical protein